MLPVIPLLALPNKRETLALFKYSNSKITIFEGLMEDWLCHISSLVTQSKQTNSQLFYNCSPFRWDDDVVFKNCAKGDEKKPLFINDTLRSEFHKKFMEKYVK